MADNTGSNLGTGHIVFSSKVGDDLQFKTLVGGTNITLANTASEITITASNDTTALNIGTGSGLFTTKAGDNIQFKSIIANAASGISLTSNADDLTLQLVSANIDAGKLGGVVSSDFLQKSNNLSGLTNLATARTNLSVYSKAEVDGFTVKNNANVLPSADNTWSIGNNSNRWAAIYANRFYGLATQAGSISALNNIGDVDTSGAVNNSVLKYNSSNSMWEIGVDTGGGGGSANFVGLSDTPGNFTGDANKYLKVNAGENAIEFVSGVATETYVNTQVANLVDSAPGTLDTLNELAAALGDDANFATTVTNSIATKLATADFNATFDTRFGNKNISDLSNVHTAAPTDGQVLAWDNGNSRWAPSNVGSGDITRVNITAGTGLTGTQDTTAGDHTQTLNVDVGTSAGKIVQLDGSAKLPAVDGSNLTNLPAAYTNASVDAHLNQSNPTAGFVLSWNGSDYAWVTNAGYTNTDFDNRLATKSTTNLAEGTNLYYTDARVNARVSALGSANWNTAYGWGDHSGAGYLTSVALNNLTDVNTAGAANGKILKYNGTAWVVADDTGGPADTDALGEGSTNLYFTNARADARIAAAGLADLGNVDAVAAGDDGKVLYYNHGTSSFKWKVDATGGGGPADTDALNEGSTNLYFTNARADARITNAGSANWNTAFGWGNHASAGYLTSTGVISSHTDVHNAAPTNGQVLKWDNANSRWAPANDTDTVYTSFNSDFDTRLASKDTGDLSEGSNLYFTNARADARIAAASINALTDVNTAGAANGKILKYNGTAWVVADDSGGPADTDALAEGSSNLYFTNARADARITNALKDEDNMASNSATHVPSQQSVKAYVDSQVASKDNTDEITEGSTNLYFTNARADARIAAATFTTLSDVGAVAAGDNGKILYYDHGTTSFKWKVDAGGPADTDALAEGSTNLYYTDARANAAFDTRLATKSTTNLAEGTNLYFTNARADARIGAANINALANVHTAAPTDGQVLKWDNGNSRWAPANDTDTVYTSFNSDFDTRLAAKDTGDLSEGSNLYFTNARADARITNAMVDEDNMASDSNTKVPTQQSVKAYVDSQVASENELSEMNDVTLSGLATNQFLQYNGTAWVNVTAGTATAGGADTQIQFNDSGTINGDAGFTYNKNTDTATVGKIITTNTGSPSVSSSGALTISTTASNSNITITPHGSGKIVLDGLSWPTADGSSGQKLTTDGAGNLSWTADEENLSNNDTDDLAEGSSNLYYTSARANADFDTRLATKSTTNLSEGTNLYFTNARADARIANNLLDEDNFASNSATNTASQQSIKAYVDAQILTKDNTDEIAEGSTNLYYTDARAQAVSINNLVEDTTPQLGGTLDANSNTIDMGTNVITDAKVGNWDTAHGWGDHSGAGYLTSISANSINDTHIDWGTGANQVSTADVPEQTNLYFTNARADARIAAASINALTDVNTSGAANGKILKYNGTAWVVADDNSGGGGPADTDALSEGSSNLYFTNARADARIGAANLADLSNVHTAAATDGQVLTWDNGNSRWAPSDSAGGEAFKTIAVSGQSDVVADASADTLTLVAGSNITLTTNAGSDSITIAAAGGGSGSTVVERFKINYATNGNLQSISDETSGISSVSIDSAAGGDITINTTGYSYPPANIIYYGYQYASNKYNVLNMNKDVTLREVPGGGSSGSPTAFGSFSSIKVKAAEADTGAGRSFGTVTHAWVQLVMGG